MAAPWTTLPASGGGSPAPAGATRVKEIFQARLGLWYDDFLRARAHPQENEQSFRRPLLHANYLMLVLTIEQINTYASPPSNATTVPTGLINTERL